MNRLLFCLLLPIACNGPGTNDLNVDNDGDGYTEFEGDCDDSNASLDPADRDGDGFSTCNADCDDTDASINVDADEVWYDGVDQNCDSWSDFDQDGDGSDHLNYGGGDCDDLNAEVGPEAIEYCDGIDNNCDEVTDESSAVDASVWYVDSDSDGYGNPDISMIECDQPVGFVADSSDCDDADSDTFPGAIEFCDGYDNNCDGSIDEDSAADASVWYADTDADGYGDAEVWDTKCDQPTGYVVDLSDCDDSSSSTYPGALEYCDGHDDDCDSEVDEDESVDVSIWYADADSDGFGDLSQADEDCYQPTGYVADSTDCDDSDGGAYPGADEYCDGHDDDCDGAVDESDAVDQSIWYADADVDGYGDSAQTLEQCNQPTGYVLVDGDCDDGDDATYPGVAYLESSTSCMTDLDEDGWGSSSPASGVVSGTDCDDSDAGQNQDDADADGYSTCDGDCDDSDGGAYPGADEYCDGHDDDCDGAVDESDAIDQSIWYADVDVDGYGDSAQTLEQCNQPTGYILVDGDCDDGDDATYPGVAYLESSTSCMTDLDEDGWGSSSPASGVVSGTDCDDSDAGQNQDDADADGYSTCDGDCDDSDAALEPADVDGDGYSTCDADCDDTDATLSPGIDADSDGYSTCEDCDDTNSFLNPSDDDGDGYSTCDGDCNDTKAVLNLDDADADGYSTCDGDCDDTDSSLELDDTDGDGYTTCDEDCDDSDSGTYPGAAEIDGDGIDQDCDPTCYFKISLSGSGWCPSQYSSCDKVYLDKTGTAPIPSGYPYGVNGSLYVPYGSSSWSSWFSAESGTRVRMGYCGFGGSQSAKLEMHEKYNGNSGTTLDSRSFSSGSFSCSGTYYYDDYPACN